MLLVAWVSEALVQCLSHSTLYDFTTLASSEAQESPSNADSKTYMVSTAPLA